MSPVPHQRRESFWARVIAETAVASVGIALISCALIANQRFLDRHFVPSFFLPRHWYVVLQTSGRLTMAILGTWLALVARRRTGRFAARTPAGALRSVIAVVLALGASELVLNRVHLRPAEWLSAEDEPRRQPDPRLGWTWVPKRTGHKSIGGRIIHYSLDPPGYRVSHIYETGDPQRPPILFSGEAVIFGVGLPSEENRPPHIAALSGGHNLN